MKPNNLLTGVREGDLGGEKIDLSFDQNSLAHIMAVLTDLYEDPELAVIREYSTNALDSHIEAGVTRPIEIYKPNSMSPFFRIVDHGLGLSGDQIRDVYSKYGASTKRESDTQTGMLGLGCKSALTYSNQFTVVGIKNGVKTIVAVSRNEEGGGVMEVVDTVATDEPNGVEISIPAKSGHFTHKVDSFFQWWRPGTVLIDGVEPRVPKMDQIADNIFVMDNNVVGAPAADIVVMGNVPYSVGNRLSGTMYRSSAFRVIAYVEMGAVNFTPSRESLHYTKKTEAEIARIVQEFNDGAKTWGQEQIDKATSRVEAFKIRDTCKARFGDQYKYAYKGEQIPAAIYLNSGILSFNPHTTSKYNMGSSVSDLTSRAKDFLYITGLGPQDDVSTSLRTKIRKYVQNVIPSTHLVVFLRPSFTATKWVQDYIDQGTTITLQEIEDYKPPRKVNPNPQPKTDPVYTVIKVADSTKSEMKLSELKASLSQGHVAYASTVDLIEYGQWSRRPETYDVISRALTYGGWAGAEYIIMLGRNRWDKLRRDLPGVKHLKVMLADKITELEKTLNPTDKLRMSLPSDATDIISRLDLVDDQELNQLVVDLKGKNSDYYLNKRNKMLTALQRLSHDSTVDSKACHAVTFDASTYAVDAKKVVARYPLLGYLNYTAPLAEKVFYVNAKYASIKDGK